MGEVVPPILTACIEGPATRNPDGYSMVWHDGRYWGAHREAYIAVHGPIPDGLVIDHLCRNRACVNIDHMEPVTNTENILRGTGWGAVNARKTHCPHGHEYTADNILWSRNPTGGPSRRCKTCHYAAAAARREAKRNAVC